MKRGMFNAWARRTTALAFATVAVTACAALALPAAAMADGSSAGSACYYQTKDTKIPRKVVGDFNSEADLLKKALSFAKDGAYKVVITLDRDWNTRDYGAIDIPKNSNVAFNLNGYMIDRDLAESSYYGVGSGDVFRVRENATLTIDGGTTQHEHKGTFSSDGLFWESTSNGTDIISGGLVAGGASDSIEQGGGITATSEGAKIYLKNVTVAGNVADTLLGVHGLGGGIYLNGKNSYLELDNAKIMYNHAENSGGGVFVNGNDTKIVLKNNSCVSNNYSDCLGGGICFMGKRGSVISTDSAVNGNSTGASGGGIYDYYSGATFSFENSQVSNNTCRGDYSGLYSGTKNGQGGGLYLEDSATVTLTKGSKISGNKARAAAGISAYDGEITVTLEDASAIEGNAATDNGGGILLCDDDQSLIMKDGSKICGNTAGGNGGGVLIPANDSYGEESIKIQMEDSSSICDNSAQGMGGGIYTRFGNGSIFSYSYLRVFSNDGTGSITGNSAAKGGALYCDGSRLEFTDISITRNSAAEWYGGIRVYKGWLDVGGKIVIAENYADQKSSNFSQYSSFYITPKTSKLLEAGSRIGIDAENFYDIYHYGKAALLNSEEFMSKIGMGYRNVFVSDSDAYKITRDGNKLNIEPGISNLMVTIYGASNEPTYLENASGVNVRLENSMYAKPGYKIDYWDVMGLEDTDKIVCEDNAATFTMPDTHVVVRAHYVPVLAGIELTLKDGAAWENLANNASSADVASVRLSTAQGDSYGIFANDDIRKAVTVKSASVQTDANGSKTVSYSVQMNRKVLDNYGICYDSDQQVTLAVSLRTDFAEAKMESIKVDQIDGDTFVLSASATIAKPASDVVTVETVNANKAGGSAFDALVEQVSDVTDKTSGGSVTLSAPDEPGWSFAGWDNLPQGAKVDSNTNAVTLSGDAAGAKLVAYYTPLASAVAITVDNPQVGEAFPTTINSLLVAGAGERDLTKYVKDSLKVSWTKADGSAAGNEVQGDTVYKATITATGKAKSYLYGYDSSVHVTVNGNDADEVNLDAEAEAQTISYYTVTKTDTRYDGLAIKFLTAGVFEASDIDDDLPESACYLLKNGVLKTAPIAWNKADVDISQQSGTFVVSGSFKDVYGDAHEVSQTFKIIDLGAPEATYGLSSTNGCQDIALSAGQNWQGDVKSSIYYLLIDADTDVDSIERSQFETYTAPVTVAPGQTLLTYAAVQLANSVKETPICGYKPSVDGEGIALQIAKGKWDYNADGVKPVLTVKLGSVKLVEGVDYRVNYVDYDKVGTAQIQVSGMGNYAGTTSITYKIVPTKVKGVAVKAAGKHKVKVSWAKHKTQTDGFQVRYGTNKLKVKSDKGKNVKVKSAKAVSKKLKGFKSGKRVYVQVRAYKVVDGKTYYSAWSKVRSAKVK